MNNFRDSYFPVEWDLSQKRIKAHVWGKQYDTGRGLSVSVISGGVVITPTNEVLRLKWEKPDGTSGYVNSTIIGGKFIIENIDQMFTVAGSIRADLEMQVGGEFVASVTFYATVEKAVAVDAIESTDHFTVIQAELARVETAIAGATVDTEVILARGAKATLGARLDASDAQLAEKEKIIHHQLVQFNVTRGLVNYVIATKTIEIPASYITLAGGTYKSIPAMSLVLPSSNIFDIYYNGTTIIAQMGNSVPTGGTYYYLFSISNATIPMISGLQNYSINGVAVNSMVYGVINTGRINYDTVSKTIVASIAKLYVNGKAITVNIQDTKAVTFGLTDTFYICLRYYDFALLATQNPTDIVVATISNGKVIYGENISINNAFKGNLTPLKDLNIWCFGDSLTKGVIEGTTTIVESYPYNLNVLTDGAHITNFGVPGATATDMLATIKTHTDFMANCDIAIIGIGTNGYLGGDFETSKDNEATQIGAYCAAIKYILENSKGKTKIVLLNPIKRMTTEGIPDRWLAAMHWNCMRIANHFGVDCIDLYKMLPILPTDTLYYSADGVHLNARGYYRMARVIYDYLMANVSNCKATGIASPAFDY